MGKRKIVVPKEVLLEAGRASNGVDPEGYFLYRPLEAVFIWLGNKLHEGNVEFYKATVGAERKRFPEDSNLAHISRRVDFEYGASFARNYIRDLFTEPELEPNKETGRDWTLTDIIQHVRLGDYDDREARQRLKTLFGVDATEPVIPPEIQHCIIADDQPISRECHNARVLEAYHQGKKSMGKR